MKQSLKSIVVGALLIGASLFVGCRKNPSKFYENISEKQEIRLLFSDYRELEEQKFAHMLEGDVVYTDLDQDGDKDAIAYDPNSKSTRIYIKIPPERKDSNEFQGGCW